MLDAKFILREIKETDILPPDRGRAVAQEINAHYYESSVLLDYGINDVFVNVIRAALIQKRDKHFWNQLGGLKRITRPLCQAPFQPPQPLCPKILIPPPSLDHDLLNLLDSQSYSDVVFMVQGIAIPAHKSCLAVACSVFEELFLSLDAGVSLRDPKPLSAVLPSLSDSPLHTADTVNLLDDGDGHMTTAINRALQDLPLPVSQQFPFCSSIEQNSSWASLNLSGMNSTDDSSLTVIHIVDCITADTFRQLLRYLYSEQTISSLETGLSVCDLNKLKKAAEIIGIQDLSFALINILKKEAFMNKALLLSVQFQRCQRRRELLVKKNLFSGQ